MFVCPNCSFQLAKTAKVCARCDAAFAPRSNWAPVYVAAEPPKPHLPNQVSSWNRGWYIIFIALGIAYASYGIYAGELYVPGKRSSGVVVRGPSAWVLAAAVLVGVAILVGRVLDHYDRRNNEHLYEVFGVRTKYAFYALLFLAMFMPNDW